MHCASAAYVDEYDSDSFTQGQLDEEGAQTYEGVGGGYDGHGTYGFGDGYGGPAAGDEDLRMQARRDVRSSDYLDEKKQRYDDALKRAKAKKQALGQYLGERALADPGMDLSPEDRARYRQMAEDAARRSRELAADADKAQADTDKRLREMAGTRRQREEERYKELKRQRDEEARSIRTYGGGGPGGFFGGGETEE